MFRIEALECKIFRDWDSFIKYIRHLAQCDSDLDWDLRSYCSPSKKEKRFTLTPKSLPI